MENNIKNKGAIITLILVFGAVFLIMLGGLVSFILFQLRNTVKGVAWNEALQVAEAGLDYYKWCLNNGVEGDCEVDKEYFNPNGDLIGEFSINANPRVSCGETIETQIFSTGWTDRFPETDRTIRALYARPSVAQFAYLLNDNVWAGEDREIRGLYHSNGGIRMDGENQSLVQSSLQEWICTSSFGCGTCPTADGCEIKSNKCYCPGVFTTTNNPDTDLFNFPVSSFDFDGITVDLAQMKNTAQVNAVYLPPSTDINSQADGYHIIFKDNGTFDVRIITRLWRDWGYSMEEGWHYDYFRIRDEYFYENNQVFDLCAVIFVEDNLWVEGKVKGKVTITSANLIDPNKDTNVILYNNIEYTTEDGSDGFAVIGENNVLIPPQSPNNMELKGIFIAQKGHFGRNHYDGDLKDKLEIIGSIVSNGRVGTKWSSGSSIVSGYLQRENYIDPKLIYSPPPFVSYISPNFQLIDWQEF